MSRHTISTETPNKMMVPLKLSTEEIGEITVSVNMEN